MCHQSNSSLSHPGTKAGKAALSSNVAEASGKGEIRDGLVSI